MATVKAGRGSMVDVFPKSKAIFKTIYNIYAEFFSFFNFVLNFREINQLTPRGSCLVERRTKT